MAKITITTTVIELSVDEFTVLAGRAGCELVDESTTAADPNPSESDDNTPFAAVSRALTRMEYVIADMIVSGLTTPQIMRDLTLSESTVKTHRSNIKRKLGSSSISGLKKCKDHWWNGTAPRPSKPKTHEQGNLFHSGRGDEKD